MVEPRLDPLARAEADDRLRSALECAGIVVWDVDLVTGHVVRSGSSSRILGIASGSGAAFAALVHPDDRARVDAALAAAYAGERPYAAEFRITTPDGVMRWVREHGEVHRDAAGTPTRLCGVTIDTSDSKQLEGARRESDERFCALANTVPDMIWIAAADGAITFASDRWLEYCGIDPMQHAHSWPNLIVHPADRERRIATFAAALRDRTSYEIEVRKRRHDGVYRWFLTRAEPVRGPDGRVTAWVGTTTDIDDRKRMEEALRDSEAQLKMAVEAGGIGAWRVDLASGAAVISDRVAEMLGLPPEQTELAAGAWQRVIHPDDRARVLAILDEAVAARSGFSLELRVVRPNGDTRWLMSMGAARDDPAPGTPADPARIAGVALDITERKAAEERQGLLMAELDHRVRNILATIQAMVSLTGRSAATPGEYAAVLRGRIAAMAATHSLLTRSQWHGADVADIVRHETQAYAEAVVARGPSGCLLRAKHALDFALALHELATNASKYGALSVPGGRVSIEWQVERDAGARRRDGPAAPRGEPCIHFVWRESGGPPVATPGAAGFGSRLIERALPEAKLVYRRDGVCCEARLPVREQGRGAEAEAEAPAPAIPASQAADPPPLLAGRRVLLVEDEPLVALELKTALEAAGAEIWTAGSLQAAIVRADAPVSAAVLDVNLGDGMIYPVARQLLARGLPILFATGYEAAAVIPADLGTVPVLQKPVDSDALVRLLAGLLRDAK